MPGEDAIYPNADGSDRYPKDPDEHAKILNWCLESFQSADKVREPLARRWRRYYKLYRSFIKRKQGDWRSKVFIPIAFYVIETVLPRLVAQLPKFIVNPVGPEDVDPAKLMEELLDYCASQGKLYLELVRAYKSALKYGTGILKTFHERDERTRKVRQPEMVDQTMDQQVPVTDPTTGQPMTDVNGQPMMEAQQVPVGQIATGKTITVEQSHLLYDGPKAEAVDLFNFWVAPEATSIEDASYVIHRVFRDQRFVQKRIEAGDYRLPPHMASIGDLWTGETGEMLRLQEEAGTGGSDPRRFKAEIMEFWTDDTVITVLNRVAVVRVQDNPFEHGEKPFVRIVDHYQEQEFYGVGEIEQLEGMQDILNALWNQRIDNVRLVLDRMTAIDTSYLEDMGDLATRPGGVVRLKKTEGLPISQIIQPLDQPDVTSSSYTEAAEIERMTEKISAVSAYTSGQDSANLNDTATGVSILSEAGNTRFSLKVRLAELTGLTPLARQFGSILQQFAPDDLIVRIGGEKGQFDWKQIDPEGLQGGFDYDIEAESSTVTESVRKDQAMTFFQLALQAVDPVSGQPVFNLTTAAEDLLEVFGKKNIDSYLTPQQPAMPPQIPGQQLLPGQDPNAMGQDPNAMGPQAVPPQAMPPEQIPQQVPAA